MKNKIRTEKVGEYFPNSRGVRQGDPLSPKLISATLEYIYFNALNGVNTNKQRSKNSNSHD